MGLLNKFFKKRSNSQPVPPSGRNEVKSTGGLASARSVPDVSQASQKSKSNSHSLASKIAQNQQSKMQALKSFGEVLPNAGDSEDDMTNNFTYQNQTTNQEDKQKQSAPTTARSFAGYETSSEETSRKNSNSSDSLQFLTTLTETVQSLGEKKVQNKKTKPPVVQEDHSNSITVISSVDVSSVKPPVIKKAESKETINTVKTNESEKKSGVGKEERAGKRDDKLFKENKRLKKEIENLRNEMLENDRNHKLENDRLIAQYYEHTTKVMANQDEKSALAKVLLSKQTENNERLINEQSNMLDALENKCKELQRELVKKNQEISDMVVQLKDLTQENKTLKFEKSSKESISVGYESKLRERDDKIKFFKGKLEDLASKFEELLEENTKLRGKLENLPENVQIQMQAIKSQGQLVFEENKYLNEKLRGEQEKRLESERAYLQEAGRLSKRLIAYEAERVKLLGRIEVANESKLSIEKKFHDVSLELSKRVKLDDHLNQVNDLMKNFNETCMNHKLEMQKLVIQMEDCQSEKRNLEIRCSELETNNKKLSTQIQVLEKNIEENQVGLGLLSYMKKRVKAAEANERKALLVLEKLKNEFVDLQNSVSKELVAESGQVSNREETNQEQIKELKDKFADKLAQIMKHVQKRDSVHLLRSKLESEKNILQILNMLDVQTNQIE